MKHTPKLNRFVKNVAPRTSSSDHCFLLRKFMLKTSRTMNSRSRVITSNPSSFEGSIV